MPLPCCSHNPTTSAALAVRTSFSWQFDFFSSNLFIAFHFELHTASELLATKSLLVLSFVAATKRYTNSNVHTHVVIYYLFILFRFGRSKWVMRVHGGFCTHNTFWLQSPCLLISGRHARTRMIFKLCVLRTTNMRAALGSRYGQLCVWHCNSLGKKWKIISSRIIDAVNKHDPVWCCVH